MRVGVVLGLVASSCSLILVRTPDPLPPGDAPSCTGSRGLPVVDIFVGSAMTGFAVATYFALDDRNNDVDLRALGAASIMAVAVPFFFSAHHGFRATAKCRAQEARFAQYEADYRWEQTAPPQHLGRAGEACWPDGSCDPGLQCVSSRCVTPAPQPDS